MAKFPQIPEPKIEGRPDSQVGQVELPDNRASEKAFQIGEDVVSNYGDNLAQLEAQQQKADEKLRDMAGDVKATTMAGDYAEKSRNLLEQLQQQYKDSPEKIPEEFRKQSLSLADSTQSAIDDPRVALKFAQHSSTINNQMLATAHDLSRRKIVLNAKNDLTNLINGNIRTAQSTTTLPGLTVAINNAEKALDPHMTNLLSDPDEAKEKMKHDMASAWVEANSPTNPAGVAIALDAKDGPLAQYLKPKELAEYQKRAQSDLKGYGETQRFQIMKEAVDSGSKAYDLFLSGDLDSKNVFQMKDALQKKQSAISANPNLTDDEKKEQTEIVGKQMATLRYLDEAARKPGKFDAAFDQEKQTKLLDSFFALGKPTDKTPKDMMKIVQLRHDLAEAEANRTISSSRAQTINRALTQMTGKSLSQEAKNTGWPVSFLGFGGRSPQQAGNVALNSYFKDKAFGKLSDDQQNQARIEYLNQMNDAIQNGRNVDVKSARKMAFDSLTYVAGRSHKTEE